MASLKTIGRTHASSLVKAGAASQEGKAADASQYADQAEKTQDGAQRRAAAGRIIAIRLVSLPGHITYLKKRRTAPKVVAYPRELFQHSIADP